MKTFLRFASGLLFIVASAASHQSNAQVNLDSMLTACYPFTGNANDSSGHNNHGTVFGATLTQDRFGKPNSAYHFNGSNSYIEVRHFDSLVPTDEVSISFWCIVNTFASHAQFQLQPDNASDRFNISVQYSHNGIPSTFWDYGSIFSNGRLDTINLPFATQWEHYVFISSASQNIMMEYRNGVLLKSEPHNGTMTNRNRALWIGKGSTLMAVDGDIDDIRFYNRVLNPAEVQALYANNPTCAVPASTQPCTTLVLQPNGVLGKDVRVSDYWPTTNFATDFELNVDAWTINGTPAKERSLIDFDLSSIPSGVVIQSAYLTMYNNPVSSNGLGNGQHSQLSGSNDGFLQRIVTPWNETTVTWNTQPSGTTQNQVIIPANSTPNQDYVFDVKTLVSDMLNNPSSSFGFLLKLQTEQYYRCLLFASSDHPDQGLHPKLVITYCQCTSLVLQPDGVAGKDAILESLPIYINTNFGATPEFNAAAWTVNSVPEAERSLVEFDLNAIPAGATIQSATLTLYNNPTSSNGFGNGQHSQASGSNASLVQRVTSSWNESTVTWNTQPSTTTLNQASLPANTTPNEDYAIDVTQMVIDSKNNPGTSFGFMLRLVTEQYYRILVFASSDHPDSTKHPKLEICYIPTGVPPQAAFYSSDTTFCDEGGSCISFFDQTTNSPTSWKWFFPGAVPDTSSQQNPSNICYYTPGTYSVTLIASNSFGPDTLVISPLIMFGSGAAAPVLIFSNDTIYCSHAVSYQWYLNGSPISGAVDSFYVTTQPGNYAVYITDDFGCSRLSAGFSVSVNDINSSAGIKIYPNPAKSQFTVYGLQSTAGSDLKIYSAIGELVYSGVINRKQETVNPPKDGSAVVDCKLNAGVYFVRVVGENREWIRKLIIQ